MNRSMRIAVFCCFGIGWAAASPQLLFAQKQAAAVSDAVKQRKAWKRQEWFYTQRAYPHESIPVDLYYQAYDQVRLEKQTLRKSGFGGPTLNWQTIGPHGVEAMPAGWGTTSGRVRAIAVDPQNANRLFVGAAAGGIWRSTNGGNSWTALGDGAFDSFTFGAIAIHPTDSDIILAGTGEFQFGGNNFTYNGTGLFRSTDGGSSWTKITQFGVRTHFADLQFSPVNPDTVYAALGSGYRRLGTTLANEGIWVSADGGVTWNQTIAFDDGNDVYAHPTRATDVLSAIGGQTANQSGVWFSNDGGQNWVARNIGLPTPARISRIHIAGSKAAPETIYAVIYDNSITTTTVFKTTNLGNSWARLDPPQNFGGQYAGANPSDQGWYDLCIGVSPLNANNVLVGNLEIHRSVDGFDFETQRTGFAFGGAWDSPMHVDYHVIAYAPSDGNVIYVGNDGGVYRSSDGGDTWSHRNSGLNTLQFYRIASSPHDQNTILGGCQDNGIMANENILPGSVQQWRNVSTGDGYACFFDPLNPDIIYASTQNMGFYRSNGGISGFNFFGLNVAANIVNGLPTSERNSLFLADFLMHPVKTTTLFTAANKIWTSTDRGDNWSALSDTVDVNGVVQTLAISSSDPNNMFCAARGRVHVSTNGGKDWSNRTAGLPNAFVARVVPHPHDENSFFVVFSGFTTGEKIYKTDDLGVTWENLSANLPNVPHNDLFINPHVPDNLSMFIANDVGVYSTSDGGGSWVLDNNDLPIVPVVDFDYTFSTGRLRIGTHGRGAFQAQLPKSNLALTTPNGGELFAADAEYAISWLSSGVLVPDFVHIELSIDNGATWTRLAENTSNDGNFTWRVPDSPTTTGLLRVINADNAIIEDQSNAPFTIFRDNFFTLNRALPTTLNGGTFTSGVWADFNNDRFADLTITDDDILNRGARLYQNDGDATFSGLNSALLGDGNAQVAHAAWGDIDNDGDLDLFVANILPPSKIYENNGDGSFTDITPPDMASLPLTVTGGAWGDMDRDGDLDLFITTEGGQPNYMFEKTNIGQFFRKAFPDTGPTRGVAWADYNNDNFQDFVVVVHGQPDVLYTNNGDRTFADSPLNAEPGQVSSSTSATWVDIDDDGDFDLFVTNDGIGDRDLLYRNNAGNLSIFTLVGIRSDSTLAKAAAFEDFNNDGFLDLIIANHGPNDVFTGGPGQSFTPVQLSALATTNEKSNSVAWADYNNDGFADVFIANGQIFEGNTASGSALKKNAAEGDEPNTLAENKTNANRWLKISLVGVASNRAGIGSQVRIKAAARWQMRQITPTTSKGGSDLVAHFGLGFATTIDSIEVRWPGSQRVTRLTDVAPNQHLTLFEITEDDYQLSAGGDLNSVRGNFIASAWGDYNNDGFPDLYLADNGGHDQLFRNLGNGAFTVVGIPDISADPGASTGGSWGDFNNDGYLDLFVAIDARKPDRLFVNLGAPDFRFKEFAKEFGMTAEASSQAASWGDFNNDGHLDLFVATSKGQQNLFYVNRGDGTFSASSLSNDTFPATGVHWVDSDNDGDQDLFVTNFKNPDILFINSGAPDYKMRKLSGEDLVSGGTRSLGTSWADYNFDGLLDVFVITDNNNFLHRNNGNNSFTMLTDKNPTQAAAKSTSSAWGPTANSGFFSLLVASEEQKEVFNYTIEDKFVPRIGSAIVYQAGQSFGSGLADVDNDGDVEVLFTSGTSARPTQLYQNFLTGDGNNWIQVRCIGSASNRAAIGARVRVKAVFNSKLDAFWQTRVIFGQTGKGAQNAAFLHFGVQEATLIDSITVDWPSGNRQGFADVDVNQILIIQEGEKIEFDKVNSVISSRKLTSTSGSWFDFDFDGDLDLLVTTLEATPNQLFINNGTGSFSEETKSALTQTGNIAQAAAWADFDNNGLVDLFIANKGINELYLGTGIGEYKQIGGGGLVNLGDNSMAAAWADVNNDGFVDLFVANGGASGETNNLFINSGKGDFEPVNTGELVEIKQDSRAAAFIDYDSDGDADLLVVNFKSANALFQNNSGAFTRVPQPPFDNSDKSASTNCVWGDFDNDGDQDIYVTNNNQPNRLYENLGAGEFNEKNAGPATKASKDSRAAAWVDFDFDGDLDLYVANETDGNAVYRNLGGGAFEDVSGIFLSPEKLSSIAIAWADFDGDHDLDFFAGAAKSQDALLFNQGKEASWIKIRLEPINSNQSAIGAKVALKAHIFGRPLWQTIEVGQQNNRTGNISDIEFGLGDAKNADSLRVVWPSGLKLEFGAFAGNQLHVIKEDKIATSVIEHATGPSTYTLHPVYPNPFNPQTTIQYQLAAESEVRIEVFNIVGQRVATLRNLKQPAGNYNLIWDARGKPSGVYFILMSARNVQTHKLFREARKALLAK